MVIDGFKYMSFNDYPRTKVQGYNKETSFVCANCGISEEAIGGSLAGHMSACKYRKEKESEIEVTDRRIQAGQPQLYPFPKTLKETFPQNPAQVIRPPSTEIQDVVKKLTELSNQLNTDFTELVFHDANAGGKQGLAMNKLSLAHQKVQSILNQLTGRSNA